MPVTPPADVAPNELIQSSWGDAVRAAVIYLDDNKLDNFQADTMAGTLTVAPTSTNTALILKGNTDQPRLQLQSGAGSALLDILATATDVTIDTLLTNRIGILAGVDIDVPTGSNSLNLRAITETPVLTLESEAGTDFCTLQGTSTLSTLAGVTDLALKANATEQARLVTGNILVGKTASALGTAGVEIATATSTGSIRSTISAASIQNLYCRHESSADANAESFADFRRATGTLIGSITQVSTTGVAYNTTSDERLKSDVGLDDLDGIGTIGALTVRRYRREDGREHVGMYAQELNAIIPQAVTIGGDDPHLQPWQTAYGSEDIIGHLILSVQQLSRQVAHLGGAA